VLDFRFRHYQQTRADFYSDLFPFRDAQNFLARDKELSTLSSGTLGVGLSYDLFENGWAFADRGAIDVHVDFINFQYDDFRDIRSTTNASSPAKTGSEPLYEFNANVLRAFISLWY